VVLVAAMPANRGASMEKDDTEANALPKRATYSTPRVVELGSVRWLTAGTSGPTFDGSELTS
jgi:hypothetical protein